MDGPITRAEHEEFRRRLEEENHRQDKRLELLEKSISEIGSLAASVERLAISVQHMAEEQERQGERLETLESRDGELWRKVVSYAATAAVGVLVGLVFQAAGVL